jgi:hypothetical protein
MVTVQFAAVIGAVLADWMAVRVRASALSRQTPIPVELRSSTI